MRAVVLGVAILSLGACVPQDGLNTQAGQSILGAIGGVSASALTNSEITAGLREALNIGTGNVVRQVGVLNGFNLDPKIHIPLPPTLARVDSALSLIGMSSLTDDLELRLNRAAELAAPKAKDLFISAISQMTINDARQILSGPNDAATQFFRRTMGAQLGQEISPIVANTLASSGAIQAYDRALGQYSQIPLVANVKADLNQYVVDRALDGIFYYVAQEEAQIRENPAARTTELLRRVFGK